MVVQFFMVSLMLDMHGASNSTAMNISPISTSCSMQGESAVNYLFCVHRQLAALTELISSNLFIIFVIDLEETW